MTDRFDRELRDLVERRADVRSEELEPLRRYLGTLPPRRRRFGRLLPAVAAGAVVMIGLGAIAVTRLSSGPEASPAATAPSVAQPSPSPVPSTTVPSASIAPSPEAAGLPAQVDPADCERMSFAPDRCLAVVERARQGLELEWVDVTAVKLTEWVWDGVARSSYMGIATATFMLRDGSSREFVVACAGLGGGYDLVCTDTPVIPLWAPYGPGAGYHDIPCRGDTEPPSECATPVPTIDPEAAEGAVPLVVAARDIPINATGRQEVLVGAATLPNGVLSDARFELADPTTRTFQVADGVGLVVRSLDPSRPPFVNIHEHGWYPGTEEVEVYLVLDVTSFTPGAVVEIRNLVVR